MARQMFSKSILSTHRRLVKNELRLRRNLFQKMERNAEAYCKEFSMTKEGLADAIDEDPELGNTFMYNAIDQTHYRMLPASMRIYKDYGNIRKGREL